MRKNTVILILSFLMIVSVFSVKVIGSDFIDMPDNWSTSALTKAVKNGLLKGDNGKIRAEENLTRAQLATIINRAFGAETKFYLEGFTDVKQTDWYYSEMAKAVAMEVFQGNENHLKPNEYITREQTFAVISRALGLKHSVVAPLGFSDLAEISSWAVEEVYSLINNGYIQGAAGKINPKGYITRAEFATIMDNIIKYYLNVVGDYTINIVGNVMVNTPGVTLTNSTIIGDLIIGDGVGKGSVVLNDVIVTGRLLVRGGAADSIIIKGKSVIDSIKIGTIDNYGRVQLEDGVEIVKKDDITINNVKEEELKPAIESAQVRSATFDELYYENSYLNVVENGSIVTYMGVSEAIVGSFNIVLDKAKVQAKFGNSLLENHKLIIKINNQTVKGYHKGKISEIFEEKENYYILLAVQQGNNLESGIEIKPNIIGYQEGSGIHPALIELIIE